MVSLAGLRPAAEEISVSAPSRPTPMTDPLLTIDDATREFQVSPKTIRRRLSAQEIDGAYKRPGPKGPEWVIPRSSLVAAGFSAAPAVEPTELPDEPVERAEYWEQRAVAAEVALARALVHEEPPSDSPAAPDRATRVTTGRPGRDRTGSLLVAAVVLLALILGFVLVSDGGGGSDGEDTAARLPGDAVTVMLAELTDPGDRIGLIGTGAADLLPADRVPVLVGNDVATAEVPRYVLAAHGDDEPGTQALADDMAGEATTVLSLDRPSGVVRVFDRRTAEPDTTPPSQSGPTTTVGSASENAEDASPTPPVAEQAPREGRGAVEGQASPENSAVNSSMPTTEVEVLAGDNLWELAARTMAEQLERAPTDAETAQYWQQVIDANAGGFVDAGNPDLLHVGQAIVLPPTP